ncbi:DOPA 4,5-dioxygenase family protein [Novosphingobium sp. Gsoil 351]|uniref:DOPA 4,5-dioxygenase family protein n=1 Tax=Novosphingobium sp. Gsoil 351 TaxID=2675225 RepID=UPI0012B4C67D|nr:DOPA 4,5-dioxygenase family protein [Novosphingobium sp. Gsoil 351]QGN53783.1 aromatic ring-opening dioxygenase [Novosphingobium sp. Gsoil 351]
MSGEAPWHAHIYYTLADRAEAAALRDRFGADPRVLFTGRMVDEPIGPHPIPQYEIHFLEPARDAVIAAIAAAGLRALIHPLTDDDLADHTTLGHWIGEPVALDIGVLDPPGFNQGVARFGIGEF